MDGIRTAKLHYIPLLLLFIYAVAKPSWAVADFERNTDLKQDVNRSVTSIADIIPDLDSLDCTPKCEGKTASNCGQYQDMDSCLDDGSAKGCFWSCE
jgi:hypothetical protein